MKSRFLDCRTCVERASELIDGELPAGARLVTRVHLFLCRDCRLHVDQLKATVKVMHGLEPPPGLAEERKRALLEALRGVK